MPKKKILHFSLSFLGIRLMVNMPNNMNYISILGDDKRPSGKLSIDITAKMCLINPVVSGWND